MLFVAAIALYTFSSFALLILEFRRMRAGSRVFLLAQFAALLMMVMAWVGISL